MTKLELVQARLRQEQDRNRQLAVSAREELTEVRRELREARKRLEPLEEAEAERRMRAEAVQAVLTRGATIARWNVVRAPPSSSPGIPNLLLSDLHVNESIDPRQTLGASAFSPAKAAKRLKTCFQSTVDLGVNHMVRPSHDGIVVPVLGDLLDLLGGFIHPGERQSQPIGVDAAALVAELLEPGFRLFADAFGGVRSYWVTGNHGRITQKMPFCDRNATNLDAVVFHILEGRLRNDKRITMELAGGPRILWTVCGHRFLGLHGDPASGMPSGGDSESGWVNIVARGVKRLRSAHMQIGQPFDTAVLGHGHQHLVLPGAITNGSLPGYSEYASARAMPYEEPKQVLFYVHPRYGVTCTWPVLVAPENRLGVQK